jgi:protein-S-isoprenylcysteine O-methyltransferase Ste14
LSNENRKRLKSTSSESESSARVMMNLLGIVGLTVALAAILIFSSGHLNWGMAWVYIIIHVGISAVSMQKIKSKYPGLLEERFHPGEGVKAWDKPLASSTILLVPVILVVSGLDKRFGWSVDLSFIVRLVALIFWLLGNAFSKWGAVSNKFYSRNVRIQKDRGHTVVTDGPYQYVRHPGYAGALVASVATPIMLGSLWAIVAVGVQALLLIIRTALEDQTLHDELLGYSEYAKQTRYRLVPGIW